MKNNTSSVALWKIWTTHILRLIVGATFIFSGFVKAIDPWGSIYKFQDYISALGFEQWGNLIIVAVFLLCSIEFVVGVFFILGCDRRLTSVVALLIMVFMLPLTLWVALTDPIVDCGCFGDALILSNWTTFWKNVILTAMIIWLILYNHKSRYFVIPELHWIVFIFTALYINIIGLFGYIYQPLIDFRPYKVGETLIDFSDSDNEINYEFIYSKNGIEQSFTIDNVPTDDEWEFVERRQSNISNDGEISVQGKQIAIYDGDNEVTSDVILDSGEQMIIFYPSLSSYSIASTYQINALQEYCFNKGIDMYAVVSGTEEEISEFIDLSMATYPIYTSEDTSIKEIVRGTPAIVYLKDGVIVWKSTLRAINNDYFMLEDKIKEPAEIAFNADNILKFFTYIYLGIIFSIVVLSHIPKAVRYARKKIMFKQFIKNSQEQEESNDIGEIS